MTHMHTISKIILASLVLAPAVALAQPAEPAAITASTAPAERVHSINLDPMGVVVGAYNANYEYLAGHHGLIAEGGFYSGGDADSHVTTYGAALGYRLHWRGRQNSGFIGAMLGFSGGSAVAASDDMSSTFDISVKEASATINVGKRWQLDMGLNVTFRIGAGYAKRWFSTTSMDPDAQQAVETVEDIMAFLPVAFDGELSLGYSF
jgi:hypothetical protein